MNKTAFQWTCIITNNTSIVTMIRFPPQFGGESRSDKVIQPSPPNFSGSNAERDDGVRRMFPHVEQFENDFLILVFHREMTIEFLVPYFFQRLEQIALLTNVQMLFFHYQDHQE